MHLLLASVLAAAISQPQTSGIHALSFEAPDGRTVLYAVSVPKGYDAQHPAPLVLVLHPGGPRTRYYGASFMRQMVEPALNGLGAVMVAPDCPTVSWTDPGAEQAVMALLGRTLDSYAIDRRRVLVTGYSLGGRGTWFMAARHADLFTAAIPMAAAIGDESVDRLGTIPTFIIHSRDDEVVPFAPAERTARQLAALGRHVRFEALAGLGHFEMGRYVEALREAGRWIEGQWAR